MEPLLSIDQLVGYQRAEFSTASHLKSWLLLLQFLVAVPAALSVFFEGDAQATYYLALLGFVLLLAWIGVDNRATAHRDVAEHARRATLIVGGLGHPLSAGTLLELHDAFIVSAVAAGHHADPNYFASGRAQGPGRLSEMVEESAFWSRHLLAGSAVFMTASFAGLVLVGLIAFGIALPHMEADGLVIVARLFLVLLVFVLSTDVYGSAVAYWAASRKVEEVRRRLIEAEARGFPMGDVLLAVSDYNSAVEAAPQSIPFIYSLRRDHLNRSWKAYQDARANHETPT